MDRDRNLLFGVFAVQLCKVTPSQLVVAASAWAAEQSRGLGEWLVQQGALDEIDRRFIDDVVTRAVQDHGGDPAVTLEAFGGDASIRMSFGGFITQADSGGADTVKLSELLGKSEHYLDVEDVPGVQETPGRYSQVSEYGRGGMGRVMLVHDAFLGRDVALKELLPGPASRDPSSPSTPARKYMGVLSRFLMEARITGQLEHPSIVPVYELGHRKDGSLYYTMKLVRGKTLHDAIHRCKNLRERLILLPHFIDLCQAIAYAHSRGILHRDIKPDNIMVGEFGETVVLDWGLAKAKDREDVHADGLSETIRLLNLGDVDTAAKTQYGQILGTPAYMSPEQARGQLEWVDERSDVYGLGAVLYKILSGKPPFAGSIIEVINKVLREDPAPLRKPESDIPPELAAICERAMQKEPGRRYESVKDLADDVQRFQSGVLVQAHAYTPAQLLRWFIRRYRVLLTAGAAAFLLVAFVTVMYLVGITRANRLLIQARDSEAAQRIATEAARHQVESSAYALGISDAQANIDAGNRPLARKQLLQVSPQLRGWEWGHLYAQLDGSLLTLSGHTDTIHSAVFSPEGHRILTASDDNTAKVWDADSGQERFTLQGHKSSITCAAFSPDGLRIVTASADNTAKVWDATTGKVRCTLTGHRDAILSAEFSPDGNRVVTAARDDAAKVWDSNSGGELMTLAGQDECYTAVFSPDASEILTASRDATATIWDATSGELLRTLIGHASLVTSAKFSPDQRFVLTSSFDGTNVVWEAKSGNKVITFPGYGAVFSTDSHQILTAQWGNVAKVLDAATGQELLALTGHTDDLTCVAYSRDGLRILTASRDNTAKVWDAKTGKELTTLAGHTNQVTSTVPSPDGRRILTTSLDNTVKVWDVASTLEPTTPEEEDSVGSGPIQFSPDGHRCVSVSGGESAVTLFDADSGKRIATLIGVAEDVTAVFSPQSQYIFTSSRNEAPTVWDAASGARLVKLEGQGNVVDSAEFSADSRQIAITYKLSESDSNVAIWDTLTGKQLLALPVTSIRFAFFSPDGSRILTESRREVKTWDAHSGKELRTFSGRFALFTPDSRRILTSHDDTTTVWDADSGKLVMTLSGTADGKTAGVFSPDGRRILTASNDNSVSVWDVESGKKYVTLAGHRDTVWTAVFSPDGSRILTASRDMTVKVWNAETGKALVTLAANNDDDLYSVVFSSDGRRILSNFWITTMRAWDTVPWRPEVWYDDLSRPELMKIAKRETPEILKIQLTQDTLDALHSIASDWLQQSSDGSADIRSVPNQGVYIAKVSPALVSCLRLEDNDLITGLDSHGVSSVNDLASAVNEFVASRRSQPEQPATLSVEVENAYAHRYIVLEWVGTIRPEVVFHRQQFAQYCRITAKGVEGDKRQTEKSGLATYSFGGMRLLSGATPLKLKPDDLITDWDSQKITGHDVLIKHLNTLAEEVTDGKVNRSRLIAKRPSTGQTIVLTIRLE